MIRFAWLAKTAMPAIVSCAAIAAAGCGEGGSAAVEATTESRPPGEPGVELPSGEPPKTLVVRDLKVGKGREVEQGDEVVTRFVSKYVTGERYESSWDPGHKPFREYKFGVEDVNPGWELGLRGMRVGGRRYLVVPPRLISYDRAATEGGPDTTLVYVIDLLAVKSGPQPPRTGLGPSSERASSPTRGIAHPQGGHACVRFPSCSEGFAIQS